MLMMSRRWFVSSPKHGRRRVVMRSTQTAGGRKGGDGHLPRGRGRGGGEEEEEEEEDRLGIIIPPRIMAGGEGDDRGGGGEGVEEEEEEERRMRGRKRRIITQERERELNERGRGERERERNPAGRETAAPWEERGGGGGRGGGGRGGGVNNGGGYERIRSVDRNDREVSAGGSVRHLNASSVRCSRAHENVLYREVLPGNRLLSRRLLTKTNRLPGWPSAFSLQISPDRRYQNSILATVAKMAAADAKHSRKQPAKSQKQKTPAPRTLRNLPHASSLASRRPDLQLAESGEGVVTQRNHGVALQVEFSQRWAGGEGSIREGGQAVRPQPEDTEAGEDRSGAGVRVPLSCYLGRGFESRRYSGESRRGAVFLSPVVLISAAVTTGNRCYRSNEEDEEEEDEEDLLLGSSGVVVVALGVVVVALGVEVVALGVVVVALGVVVVALGVVVVALGVEVVALGVEVVALGRPDLQLAESGEGVVTQRNHGVALQVEFSQRWAGGEGSIREGGQAVRPQPEDTEAGEDRSGAGVRVPLSCYLGRGFESRRYSGESRCGAVFLSPVGLISAAVTTGNRCYRSNEEDEEEEDEEDVEPEIDPDTTTDRKTNSQPMGGGLDRDVIES
ncbi:hypothetical protein F7725_016224 [Dissostichus mawsoni]|uniref:Uncharacterized protein n=1 Tax=Dissostichus mawsoni TaxID=36200 RepID=A0A7J5Z305_DISMA|nr:hypothetical protein F7725_016224 [Dissostichus mawsoni]